MLAFLKHVKASVDARRLRRRGDGETSPDAHADLCRRLVRQGRWDEAFAVAKDGLRLFPRSPVLQDQARLLWKRNETDVFRALEAEYEAHGGEEASARLVEHLLEAGEIDLAVTISRRTARAHASSASASALFAAALERRFGRDLSAADGAEALCELRRAVELAPGDPEILGRLGELSSFIGARAAARQAFEAAAAACPSEPRYAAAAAAVVVDGPDEDESSLLHVVELETDEREPDAAAVSRATSELARMAKSSVVRRMAFARSGLILVANIDGARVVPPDEDHPFGAFAAALRPRLVSAAKRLGAGAVQEVEMIAEQSRVLAYAGGGGLLIVDVEPRARIDELACGFRAFVSCMDVAEGGDA